MTEPAEEIQSRIQGHTSAGTPRPPRGETGRCQETAVVATNEHYRGDYHVLTLQAPAISTVCAPGQFVHLQIPDRHELTLRRPFSIFDATPADGTLKIFYKRVGQGTARLAEIPRSTPIDLIGPLGTAFPKPEPNDFLILVAGGYGAAALYLLEKRFDNPGVCLIGGRTGQDVVLDELYARHDFPARVATEDGSRGHQGMVTDLLREELNRDDVPPDNRVICACGPNPMLRAVADIGLEQQIRTWISMDQHMCCGSGACFACVVKVKDRNSENGWTYVRSCREGPVFDARTIYWDA